MAQPGTIASKNFAIPSYNTTRRQINFCINEFMLSSSITLTGSLQDIFSFSTFLHLTSSEIDKSTLLYRHAVRYVVGMTVFSLLYFLRRKHTFRKVRKRRSAMAGGRGVGSKPPSADCTRSSSSRTVCEKISPWLAVDWLESGGCVSTQCLNPGDLLQAAQRRSGGRSLLTRGEQKIQTLSAFMSLRIFLSLTCFYPSPHALSVFLTNSFFFFFDVFEAGERISMPPSFLRVMEPPLGCEASCPHATRAGFSNHLLLQ